MSLAPFSMPRRRRRLSFSRSIPSLPEAAARAGPRPSLRIGRPAGSLDRGIPEPERADRLCSRPCATRRDLGCCWRRCSSPHARPRLRSAKTRGASAPRRPRTSRRRARPPAEAPRGQSYGVDRRGGLSRGEWRSSLRRGAGRLSRASARRSSEAEAKLDESAGSASNWQVAPVPGMQPSPDAPLDYQLRRSIRRHKSEIERLERKLRSSRSRRTWRAYRRSGVPDARGRSFSASSRAPSAPRPAAARRQAPRAAR